MNIYKENVIVDYRDVDRDYDIKLPQLLEIFGTISTKHTNELGFDPFYLNRRGMSWVLYEWKLDIKKTRLYAETVRVETFAVDRKGMYFIRYFGMYDKDNVLIARASAKWVIINVEQRKLVKLPQEIVDIANIDIDTLSDEQKWIYDIPEKSLRIEKREDEPVICEFDVRFYDIDANNHVNNVKYVDWAIESMHSRGDFLKKYKPCSLSIVYKKESGEDHKILCKTYIDNLRTYHEIYAEDNLLNVIVIEWTEK